MFADCVHPECFRDQIVKDPPSKSLSTKQSSALNNQLFEGLSSERAQRQNARSNGPDRLSADTQHIGCRTMCNRKPYDPCRIFSAERLIADPPTARLLRDR